MMQCYGLIYSVQHAFCTASARRHLGEISIVRNFQVKMALGMSITETDDTLFILRTLALI